MTPASDIAANPGARASEPAAARTYAYDALHRRVWREDAEGQTLFIHDAWNVIAEYTPSPTLKVFASPRLQRIWGEDLSRTLQGAGGIGGLLLTKLSTENGTRTNEQAFSYDSNGNVILLTDATGATSATYRYDAFGMTTKAEGPQAKVNRYRFSTKPVEHASNLLFYGYRYYDPVVGRWPSRDPIAEVVCANLYAMVGNELTNAADVLGLLCSCDRAKIEAKILEYSRRAAALTSLAAVQMRFEWCGVVCCDKTHGNILAQDPIQGAPPRPIYGGPIINGQQQLIGWSQAGSCTPDPNWCATKFGSNWELGGLYHSHPDTTPLSPDDLNLSGLYGVPIGVGYPDNQGAVGAYGLGFGLQGPIQSF